MTQQRVVRIFILGLPIGLIIGGVIAMVLYFRDDASKADHGHSPRAVSRDEIESQVNMLSKMIGSRQMGEPVRLRATIKYIEGTLDPTNLGYKVAHQTYKVAGVECHNLVVELPGTHHDHRHEILIVGAHYDSVPGTPGADDNASGVAACMSLAQAFYKSSNARTIRFVFFANEEPPYFQTENMGSLVYAKGCRERGENIIAMLSLESMGYYSTDKDSQKFPPGLPGEVPDTGSFLAVVGNTTSAPLVDHIRAAFEKSPLPCIGMALPASIAEQGWSDHWSFWQQGYPAVMITDTALFRNPHYHQPTDTADTLDFVRLTQAVKGLELALKRLANPGMTVSGK